MERNDSPEPDAARFRILAYATRKAAEQAYDEFIMLGVRPEDISLFVQAEKPNDGDAALDHDIDVGGAVGASASAVAGGVGGLLAGLGLLIVPGLGPLLAVGPVAAALTGAAMGGALGGLAGSLMGAGVGQVSALAAERHLAAGRAIITLFKAAWNDSIAEAAGRSPLLIGIDADQIGR